MKILFFTPLPKWPIHVGVQLDEIIEWQKKGHEIIYVYNNCCYNGLCSANMSADTSECMLCKFDVFHMLKLVPKGVKKVNLNSFWPKDLDVHFQYNNVDELKKIEYKGVKTGYSVLSTYITATRNLAPLIDASSRPFFDRLLLQSCKLTDAFEKILDKYHPERVCFYNARLLEQRPEYDLARNRNIETYSYEVYAGVGEPFYKTKYINVTPHNVESLHIRYQKLWDETDLSLTEKEKIGRAYFSKKRAGIAVGDKVYIASQTKGKLPQNWNENVENIVIFNSSEDEFPVLERPKAVVPPKEQPVENPQPTVSSRAIYKGSNNPQAGGLEGITSQPGDHGKPNGLAGIKQYDGKGGKGNGIGYDLGGRGYKNLTMPPQGFPEEGHIVVEIWVDREGQVIRAEISPKGSTIVNNDMRQSAIQAAKRSIFNTDPDAPEEQHGTITYTFVINQ